MCLLAFHTGMKLKNFNLLHKSYRTKQDLNDFSSVGFVSVQSHSLLIYMNIKQVPQTLSPPNAFTYKFLGHYQAIYSL